MGKRSRSKSSPRAKNRKSRNIEIIPETSPSEYNKWPSAQRGHESESDSDDNSGSEIIRRDVFNNKDKVNYLAFFECTANVE